MDKIEFTATYDWGTPGTYTWHTISDFLKDSLTPGAEEIIFVEMGDDTNEQDGVRLTGSFKALGDTLPTAGTRTWFRFTRGDVARVVGGESGSRVGLGKSNVQARGSGQPYTMVSFSCAGETAGDCVEADQSN